MGACGWCGRGGEDVVVAEFLEFVGNRSLRKS